MALGGNGNGTFEAIKSLTTDKLIELNKMAQEVLAPLFSKEDIPF